VGNFNIEHNRLTKSSLYESAVDYIENLILDGKVEPGEKIPSERELVELLGISRTVLREALRVLESKSLISIFPGKGVYVRKPGLETVIDPLQRLLEGEVVSPENLMQARFILEPEIARLASINADDVIIKKLEIDLKEMIDYTEYGEKFILADQNFHEHLAVATKNPVLVIMVKPIIQFLTTLRETVYLVPGKSQKAIRYHTDILTGVKVHNPSFAMEAMRMHLSEVMNAE